jgi:hypothetical protein
MQNNERLFFALIALAGIGTTVLTAIVVFSF